MSSTQLTQSQKGSLAWPGWGLLPIYGNSSGVRQKIARWTVLHKLWASLKQICILNLFVSLKFDWNLYFTWLAKHQSGACTATSWIFAQPFCLSCYSHNIASHLNRHAGLYVICLHGMIIIYSDSCSLGSPSLAFIQVASTPPGLSPSTRDVGQISNDFRWAGVLGVYRTFKGRPTRSARYVRSQTIPSPPQG